MIVYVSTLLMLQGGGLGVKLSGKKHYVTLEWLLCSVICWPNSAPRLILKQHQTQPSHGQTQ